MTELIAGPPEPPERPGLEEAFRYFLEEHEEAYTDPDNYYKIKNRNRVVDGEPVWILTSPDEVQGVITYDLYVRQHLCAFVVVDKEGGTKLFIITKTGEPKRQVAEFNEANGSENLMLAVALAESYAEAALAAN